MTTYRDRILSDLSAGAWVCPVESWIPEGMLSYSQRISNINAERQTDRRIISRTCHRAEHRHRSTIAEYRDNAVVQLRLRGVA